MKVLIILGFLIFLFILYLFNKIEKLKIKILYLSKQNSKLIKQLDMIKNYSELINCIKNTEVNLVPLNISNVLTKNISSLKIAPFDFAPKISDIPKNSNIYIISKINILNIQWYEITLHGNNSFQLNGWVKECNIDFIYNN